MIESKTYYFYDPNNNEYRGSGIIAINTENPNPPSNATEIEPPTEQLGKDILWNSNHWIQQDIEYQKPIEIPLSLRTPEQEIEAEKFIIQQKSQKYITQYYPLNEQLRILKSGTIQEKIVMKEFLHLQEVQLTIDLNEVDGIILTSEDVENQWQSAKPLLLKQIENNYIDFLETDWSNCLINNNIISEGFIINIDNTGEVENVNYLIQLKNINKNDYYIMAGEFDRYKSIIVEYGGVMSKIIFHDL